MNTSKSWAIARPAALALALFGLVAISPAYAQQVCDLANNDPAENTGGSTATGNLAVSCGISNDANGEAAIAIGAFNRADGIGSLAIGFSSIADADSSVALGRNSVADRANTVSIGNSDNARQLTNVAAGTEGTDAVNVNQMQAGDAQTLSAANAYTDQKFAGIDFGGINDRFDAVDRRINHLDDRLDRAGALSAAMVGMAASAAAVEGGQTRVGIAAGTYGGKQALSIGVQRRFSPHTAMTLGGAFSGSERSATVGVGFGF